MLSTATEPIDYSPIFPLLHQTRFTAAEQISIEQAITSILRRNPAGSPNTTIGHDTPPPGGSISKQASPES